MLCAEKGPDEIPRSWLLFYAGLGFWLLVITMMVAVSQALDIKSAWIAIGGLMLELFCYGIAIEIAGYRHRRLQALTAIVGIGAILTFAQLANLILLLPFFGPLMAWLLNWLIVLWSIPAKGNIMARTIGWHPYSAMILAASVLVLRVAYTRFMTMQVG